MFCKECTLVTGITPACAGKRALDRLQRHLVWDHPRVCGEKIFSQFRLTPLLESPPRVRGKDKAEFLGHRVLRITPACAGKR